jgi:hypothetical protein
VLGFTGEPYLRFTPGGVQANARSPTWVRNRAQPDQATRLPPAGSAPLWKTVSHGHAYVWHEDRLGALAALARAPGSQLVGTWTLPLEIDGHAAQLRGSLTHVDAPRCCGLWPLAVMLFGLPALLRLQRGRLNAAFATTFLLATLAAIAVTVSGRLFYGRPSISTTGWVELAVTFAVIALSLGLAVRPDWQILVGILVCAVGLAVGLSSIGALLHGFVIAALPSAVQRAAVATCLAAGAGLVLTLVISDPYRVAVGGGSHPAHERDARPG